MNRPVRAPIAALRNTARKPTRFKADSTLPNLAGATLTEGMPRYRWIREQLLKQIVDGRLRRGEPLASEADMAREFGVSLGTMRKAIDGLVEQHVLVRSQGKRTSVATRNAAASARLRFHLVSANDRHELPEFDAVLKLEVRRASEHEARQLKLAAGADIIELQRTRVFADGRKMLEWVFLPRKLFPNFRKKLGSARPVLLYEFYEENFGVCVMDFDERIRAVLAPSEDAALIGCQSGAALLEIERLTYSYQNEPVELRISRCETGPRHYLHGRSEEGGDGLKVARFATPDEQASS